MGSVKKCSVAGKEVGRGIGRAQPVSDDSFCYTVPEAAKKLRVSRNFGYELARTGKIPIVRLGKRMLVPKAAFHKMLGVSPENEAGK
jgi:excisionase family DNA binding protein